MENNKSGLSVAAMVLGIIGIALSFIPIINNAAFVLGILAFIFGLICLFKKKGIGKAVTGVILGVTAIVVTIVMQTYTVKSIDKALDDFSSDMSDITGDNTESLLKNDIEVTFGTFQIENDEFFESYKLPVTIKNKGKEKSSFSVKIEAVDASSARIDNDTVYVDSLNAGQTQEAEAFTLITEETAQKFKNAEFKVLEVSKY